MKSPEHPYLPSVIEPKWQKLWEENKTFGVTEDQAKPKYYCLEMFPYPSGKIHMGHVRNYTIGDVVARYKRMCGFNVLHPIGYDAFGMPAENAAIENKVPPAVWTDQNMGAMNVQFKRMGFSYDWDRELATCRSDYYRWEQLVFLKMFEKGLVYKKKSFVNWCERCQTVLANEQVVGNACWRCESEVAQKPLEQWFFKITAYAPELLAGIQSLSGGWPERVLTMQREWIGESEGAMVRFPLEHQKDRFIEIFTTRPDTLFGATFMSLAAEHPLVLELSKGTPHEKAVKKFIEKAAKLDRSKRLTEEYEKEGVFTGATCLNPLTARRMPIYAANFVLMEYGTGAVMAVPAHDQRDFEFSKKYELPIEVVIQPSRQEVLDPLTMKAAYVEAGVMVNSGPFDGISSEKMRMEIVKYLQEKGIGEKSTTYKLRDWGISRQRYWGAPIPILYCPNCGMVPVPEQDLPVTLPTDVEFTGQGGSPLKKNKKFLESPCPRCHMGTALRETDTMDTFVESSWYFLRYCSPQYAQGPFDPKAADYWMPVDQYIGGIEHAVLHLLYARFFTKVLRDLGFFSMGKGEENLPPLPLGERAGVRGGPFSEPFTNLLTQGMVVKDGAKMSKSKGNVVDPNYLIEKYGADTARLFSLFAAPPEKDLDWNDQGVEGMYRFLGRVWRFITELMGQDFLTAGKDKTDLDNLKRKLNQTIKKVTDDLERFHFNTAIAALMELLNFLNDYCQQSPKPLTDFVVPPSLNDQRKILKDAIQDFVKMLAPLVPHVAEELWASLGHKGLVSEAHWPDYDPSCLQEESVTLVVQVNGVVRSTLSIPVGSSEEAAKQLATGNEKIQRHLEKKTVVKVIYVPNRLINFVVKS